MPSIEPVVNRLASATLAVCAVVLLGTATLIAFPAARTALGLGVASAPAYEVGDRIDVPTDLYAGSDYTLLVFARSSCSASAGSKPALAAVVADLGRQAGFGAAMLIDRSQQSSIEAEEKFAEEIGIDSARLAVVDASALRVRYVPTVVLVDRTGTVMMAREGLIDDVGRDDVLDELASVSRR